MKIAHITSVHPQNDNRIFYKECTTLMDEGYEVVLIVAGGETKKINGVQIIGYPKVKGRRLERMIKTSFFDMIKVCKKIDADIYHFHDPELIFTGLYLKSIGKKVIYDIHENNPASILSKPYIKSKVIKKIISKTFNIFERSVLGFFNAIVTARPDISRRFQHKNLITLRNFPLIPEITDIDQTSIQKEKPSVIFVGGMTKLRGIYGLLDAFETLDAYELWLLGPINDIELKKKIESGCKNVKYFGMVEPYDIFSYISKADIGIITFLPAPNHIETLATKPFEYMACGKPMIMSNFKYWQETFGESSLYVDPENVDEIRKSIRALLDNTEERQRMGKMNLDLANGEYNWFTESKKLIHLYKKVENQ